MTQYVKDAKGETHAFPDEATPEAIAQALGGSVGLTKAAVIAQAAQATGLNPKLLQGLVQTESHGNDNAQGVDPKTGVKTPNVGITQLSPAYLKQYNISDPSDYTQTIPATADILAQRLKSNGGDITDALKFYHGGPNQKNWGQYTNAYPDQVFQAAGIAPGDALQYAGQAPSTIPNAANVADKGPVAQDQGLWGAATAAANGLALGASPYIQAGVNTLVDATGLRGAFPAPGQSAAPFQASLNANTYANELAQAKAQQAQYAEQHPVVNALATAGAATVPTMLGLGAAGEALAPGLDALRGASPLASKAVQFATGNAGNYGRGLGQAAVAVGSQGVRGAAEGAGAGLLQSGLNPQPAAQQTELGTGVGAVVNPLTRFIANSIVPYGAEVNPLVAQAAQKLGALGVDLRGGQIAKSKAVQQLDATLFNHDNTGLLEDYTRAASHTIGQDSAALTPEVMGKAETDIGKKFDVVKGVNNLVPFGTPVAKLGGQTLQDHLDGLYNTALNLPIAADTANKIDKLHNLVSKAGIVSGGNASGDDYLALTQSGGPIQTLMKDSDPVAKRYAAAVRQGLDAATDAGATALGRQDLVQNLATARSQWKNMLTLEPLAEKAQPHGLLNPQALQGRVANMFSDYGYSPDAGGALGDLAEGGRYLSAPSAQGEAKAVSTGGNMLTKHPIAAGTGLVVAGTLANEAAHALPAIAADIGEHPFASAAALGAGGLALGAKAGIRQVQRAAMGSPEYRNWLIQNAINPSARRVGGNALVPSTVLGANDLQGARK